jgi:hypothetical protein
MFANVLSSDDTKHLRTPGVCKRVQKWSNIRVYVKEAPVLQISYLRHKYIKHIKINHMEQVR